MKKIKKTSIGIALVLLLANFVPFFNRAYAEPASSTLATFDYTWTGTGGLDWEIDGQFIGAMNGNRQWDEPAPGTNHTSFQETYNTSDQVTFNFKTLWIDIIDTLTVNSTDCSNNFPTTKEEYMSRLDGQIITISCTVPKSNTHEYTITSNTHDLRTATDVEKFMGNFDWDNDINSTTAFGDDIIGHGYIDFVKVVYEGVTYDSVDALNTAKGWHFNYSNHDNPTDPDTNGNLTLPVGAKVTMRLIPEPGYQLTSFGINGGAFIPQANVGEYTFDILPGNGHLAAKFTKVDDKVVANADAVQSGSITLGGNGFDMGTAKLNVNNVNLEPADIEGFENAAGDYKVSNFLDISLYKTVYKGSEVDSWDTQIEELENEATITITLEEGIDGNDVVIVHQKHDGTYEVIPSVYDPVARTITFKTSSFSNYAIAARTIASPNTGLFTTESGSAVVSTAGTFILVLTIVSSLYIASYYLALEKQNREK